MHIKYLVITLVLTAAAFLPLAASVAGEESDHSSLTRSPPDELKDFKVGLAQGKVGHKWRGLLSGYSPTFTINAQPYNNFSAFTDPAGNVRFVVNVDFDDDTDLYNGTFYARVTVQRTNGSWYGFDTYKWESSGTAHKTDLMYIEPDDTGFGNGEVREYSVEMLCLLSVWRATGGWVTRPTPLVAGTVEVIGNTQGDPFQQLVTIVNPQPSDVYEIGQLGQIAGKVETTDGVPIDNVRVVVAAYAHTASFHVGVVTTLVDGTFSDTYTFHNPDDAGDLRIYANDDPKTTGIYNDDQDGAEVEIEAVWTGGAAIGLMADPPGYVLPGESAEYMVKVAPFGGYEGSVALGVTGLSEIGASASFDPSTVTLPADPGYEAAESILTIQTTGATPVGALPFTITATGTPPASRELACVLDVGASGACHDGETCLEITEALCTALELQYDGDGTSCPPPTSTDEVSSSSRYCLQPSYPNPFNPSTTIQFDLPRVAQVSMTIFDVSGRRVCSILQDELLGPGPHRVQWEGRDDEGRPLASGVYIVRLQAGDTEEVRKLAILR